MSFIFIMTASIYHSVCVYLCVFESGRKRDAC